MGCGVSSRELSTHHLRSTCAIDPAWRTFNRVQVHAWAAMHRILSDAALYSSIRLDADIDLVYSSYSPSHAALLASGGSCGGGCFLEFILEQIPSIIKRRNEAARGNDEQSNSNAAQTNVSTSDLPSTRHIIDVLNGAAKNIRRVGFNWKRGPARSFDPAGSILHRCMMSFESDEGRAILPAMIRLVAALLAQPAKHRDPINSGRNIRLGTPLLTLFQRNTGVERNSDLLPLILLLRKHGADPNPISIEGIRIWDCALPEGRPTPTLELYMRWMMAEKDLAIFDFTSMAHIHDGAQMRVIPSVVSDSQQRRRAHPHVKSTRLFDQLVHKVIAHRSILQPNLPLNQLHHVDPATLPVQSSLGPFKLSSDPSVPRRVVKDAQRQIRPWLKEKLDSLNNDFRSTILRERFRLPYLTDSRVCVGVVDNDGDEADLSLSEPHATVTALIDACRDESDSVSFSESDEDGASLLTLILPLPTCELNRLHACEARIYQAIDESPNQSWLLRPTIFGLTPLDLMFHIHRAVEVDEFAYRLLDCLLSRAMSATRATPSCSPFPPVDVRIGSISSWWSLLGSNAFGDAAPTTMRHAIILRDLLAKHGIHSCRTTRTDLFTALFDARDADRLAEWLSLNRSTDSLWPIRDPDLNPPPSLLDAAHDCAARTVDPHLLPLSLDCVRVIDHEWCEWSSIHWPHIRLQLSDHIIPDLADIVIGYVAQRETRRDIAERMEQRRQTQSGNHQAQEEFDDAGI